VAGNSAKVAGNLMKVAGNSTIVAGNLKRGHYYRVNNHILVRSIFEHAFCNHRRFMEKLDRDQNFIACENYGAYCLDLFMLKGLFFWKPPTF
jgi:hypothetical protein